MSLRGRLNQYATDWREQHAAPRLRKPTPLPSASVPDISDGVDVIVIIVLLLVIALMAWHFIAKFIA